MKSYISRSALIILAASSFVGLASAQVQTVTGTLSVGELSAGQATNLTVTYAAADSDGNEVKVTGLGLRLHYDSSVLEMGDYTDRLRESAQPFQIKDDTSDFDGDASTDKYFLTSWADTSGDGWPYDAAQPATLYAVPLTAISGFNGSTLKFTASSTAAGYSLSAADVAISKIPGTVSTLSDLTASYTISSGESAVDITIPADKTGNGPDAKIGNASNDFAADNALVVGSYVSGDLTFIRPPVQSEADSATWGNSNARDLDRVGTNLYFRRLTHEQSVTWCASMNGRLASGPEINTHLRTKVGANGDGTWETDLDWPQKGSHYWSSTVGGDDDGSETRHKAFITYNSNSGISVHEMQARANTTKLWPLCVDSASATSVETAITLDPAFASDVTSYSASVANPAGTASIVPVLTDSFASVSEFTANGTAVTANTFDVAEGANDIIITVLAEDGVGTTTYSVALTRAEAMAVTLASSDTVTTVNQSAYSVSGTCNVADVSVSVTFTDGSATASSAAAACTSSAWTASADVSGLSDGTVTITAVGTSPGETSTVSGSANKDTQGPVVSVPADITVDAESASGTPASDAAIAVFLQAATASDATDGTVSVTNDSPATFPVGATVVTFSAADSLGNVGSNSATVTVEDQSPPVITIEDTTIAATDSGGTAKTDAAVAAWLASATSTDNVDGTLTEGIGNDYNLDVFPLGDTEVTFSITDSSGLSGSAKAVLTITDLTAPVVSAPTSITVAATNAAGTASSMSALAGEWKLAPAAGALAVGPNVNEVGAWWSNDDAAVTDRACLFDDVVKFGADGAFHNVMGAETWVEGWQGGGDACAAPVAPHDGSASATYVYDANAATITVNGLGAHIGLPKVHNNGELGASADAVSTITYAISEMSASAMTLQVNYGGDAIWQFKLSKAKSPTAEISAFLAGATATDNVDGALAVTNDGLALFPLGETTVIFSATDAAGNLGTDSATVTVTDQTAPVLTAPADGEVPATDANGTAATDPLVVAWVESAVATDNVDASLTITNDAPAVLPLGATVVTFTVTDAAGNSTSATATATVADTTAPEITAPGSLIVLGEDDGVAADNAEIVAMIAAVTALDNVDGAITGITNDAPADVFPLGDTTITFTATDAAGNSGTAQTVVTVALDVVAPELTVPGSISINVDMPGDVVASSDSAIVAFLAGATATDNRDGDVTASITNDAPSEYVVGETIVNFSVSDAIGNTSTGSASVTVVVLDTDGDGLPDFYENQYGLDPNDASDGDGDLDGDGFTNAEEYAAGTDPTKDELAPELTIPGDISMGATGRMTEVALGEASATDLKDGSLTPTASAAGPFKSGLTEITWTVSDAAGNVSSEVQKVEIMPLANLTPSSVTVEGASVHIKVELSGHAAAYPVTIPLVIDGTATMGQIPSALAGDWKLAPMAGALQVGWDADNVGGWWSSGEGEVTGRACMFDDIFRFGADGSFANVMGAETWLEGWQGVDGDQCGAPVAPHDGSASATFTYDASTGSLMIDGLGAHLGLPKVYNGGEMSNPADAPTSVTYTVTEMSDSAMTIQINYVDTFIWQYKLVKVASVAATGDFTVDDTVTITSGTMGMVTMTINEDSEAESSETVVISLGSPTNAVVGSVNARTVTIVEENVAPAMTLTVTQGTNTGRIVAADGGIVTVTASYSDVNAGDTHTFDWDAAVNEMPGAVVDGSVASFDPATLGDSVVSAGASVTDSGNPSLTTSASAAIKILAAAPVLGDADSDGDGVSDADEGYGDSDNDGIPDYQDNIPESYLAPVGSSGQVVQSAVGTSLVLGDTALADGNNEVGIDEEDVGTADADYNYLAGLVDFEVSGAQSGASYMIVLPLSAPVPENAVLRKFIDANVGWQAFVENATNGISSATASSGTCPEPGSASYAEGLIAGSNCLQLMIEDGGANDADGAADGTVTDPSGIATLYFGPPSTDSTITISVTELNAGGEETAEVTVTAVDSDGRSLAGMTVTGSVSLTDATIGSFTEGGGGVYTATVTPGNTGGDLTVTATISDGTDSASITSTTVTVIKKSSSKWYKLGGCAVGDGQSSDSSLILLMLIGLMLMIRRRFNRV
jgi:hypothetical protein